MYARCSVATASLAFSIAAQAQNLGLVGYGYYLPQPAITAAPGQVMMISVFGIRTPFPVKIANNQLPKQINGVSVTLRQANTAPVIAGLFGIQQTACSQPATCAQVTNITMLMPFELAVDNRPGPLPVLEIQENGVVTGQIPVRPIPDSIHILNA